MSVSKLGISAVIVFVLGAQFIIGFTYHAGTRWPFISYPMYSGAKYDGDRLDDFNLRVFLDRSESYETVGPSEMDMSYWIFRKNIIVPINRDQGLDRRNLSIKFCENYGAADYIHLKLYDIGAFISKSGLSYDEPRLISEKELNCGNIDGKG